MPPKASKKKKSGITTTNSKLAEPHTAQVNYKTYMFQVTERVPPVIVEALYEIYQDACTHCQTDLKDAAMTQRFKIFQRLLSEVSQWEDDEIEEEAERFREQVPWLREVLRQILVSQVHIMLSMRADRYITNTKFSFEMPSEEEIVFHFMRTCARTVKPQARLFDHQVGDIEIETNLMAVEEVVRRGVERAVASLVPIGDIVKAQYGDNNKKKKASAKKKLKPVVAEVKMEDGVKEGESNSEINEEELEALDKENAAKGAEAEKAALTMDQQKAAADAQEHEKNKMQLLPGEEHVDDTDNVDGLISQMQALPRGDPRRAEYKQKIKNLL